MIDIGDGPEMYEMTDAELREGIAERRDRRVRWMVLTIGLSMGFVAGALCERFLP